MEPVVTQRGGRFVIPVRSEYKNQIPGMVHDTSSTGSTIFIEPASSVRLNNEIRELQIAEKQEIQIILGQLSAEVAEESEQILADMDIVTGLDHIFACARLALDMKAFRPVFTEDLSFDLKEARHPLIDEKNAVPIDIYLGKEFDQLIITGPNTGGKTVSLKTAGLLSLMGQSGLHIPALDGSSLCIFQEIYARLILYNITMLLIHSVKLPKKDLKYARKLSVSDAVVTCRYFLIHYLTNEYIKELLLKYLTDIRPGRVFPRKTRSKRFVPLTNRT
jgi:dsDNA-specific endonuclease/ATPase MutS2